MSVEGPEGRVVLILGGVRSGKSRYAQHLAAQGKRVAFIATAEGRDEEMSERIARHQEERPPDWTTIEAPIDLPAAVLGCEGKFDAIVVDCLTLWASNLMEHEHQDTARISTHIAALTAAVKAVHATVILVSNEVGSGIVPDNEMSRCFRDLLGGINQRIAAVADEVVLLVAGCPLFVKRTPEVRLNELTTISCGCKGHEHSQHDHGMYGKSGETPPLPRNCEGRENGCRSPLRPSGKVTVES